MAGALLFDELSDIDRAYLENMSLHEGWKVFVRLLNEKCAEANAAVIRVDPDSENYERKLAECQRKARFMSEFCSRILESMDFHISKLVTEKVVEDDRNEKIRMVQEMIRGVGAVAGPEILTINNRRTIQEP